MNFEIAGVGIEEDQGGVAVLVRPYDPTAPIASRREAAMDQLVSAFLQRIVVDSAHGCAPFCAIIAYRPRSEGNENA